MKEQVRKWSKAMVAAFVTGAAGSFLSALGISGANAAGLQVNQLDAKQLGFITLFGGLVGAAAYLKQSPVPPEQ